jgi:hypothetical protein
MRRVVAVLGAVLMVVVAILVRGLIDGDDEPGGGNGDGGRDGDGNGQVTLLCADELVEVCDGLVEEGAIDDFETEGAGATVDRMAVTGADLGADAWLTFDSFPQQVDVLRESAGANRIFGDPTSTDHSTGLAIVAANDRADALAEECGDVDWVCLEPIGGTPWSDHNGQSSWGAVKLGYDSPGTSGVGLLVLAQAMASLVERTDFAAQDIDRRALADLEDAVPTRTSDDVLEQLALQGPAAFGAVGALGNAAQNAGGSRNLETFYPDPMFRAEVVLAAVGGDADGLLDEDALGDALANHDWEAGQDVPELPSAGALVALRQAWEELR